MGAIGPRTLNLKIEHAQRREHCKMRWTYTKRIKMSIFDFEFRLWSVTPVVVHRLHMQLPSELLIPPDQPVKSMDYQFMSSAQVDETQKHQSGTDSEQQIACSRKK